MSLYNLVNSVTPTLGTGSVVAGAAVAGYNNWSGVPNGAVVSYGIRERNSQGVLTQSEAGLGTWNAGTSTLSRDTVRSSTNGGAKINLTTGLAEVYITAHAEDFDHALLLNIGVNSHVVIDATLTVHASLLAIHDAHLLNTSNPHSTTAAQVGASPVGHFHSESDPIFSASAAAGIDAGDIAFWDAKQPALGYTPVDIASASWVDLTDGGATVLHSHAGGGSGDISGTGVVGQVAEFVTDTKTIQAAKLIGPAANILTITNAAASTLALNITAAKTLTLTAADNYTLTVPASLTVAGQNYANVFTALQTLPSLIAADWGNVASFTPNGSDDGWQGYTIRQIISSAQLTNTGAVSVRISIKSSSTLGLTISKCYIGAAAASGDAYDFEAAPTQVTFDSGSAGFTVAANTTKVSDSITFAVQAGKNLIVSFFVSASGSSGFASRTSQTGWSNYYVLGDFAATVDPSGLSNNSGWREAEGVTLIEAAPVTYFELGGGYTTLSNLVLQRAGGAIDRLSINDGITNLLKVDYLGHLAITTTTDTQADQIQIINTNAGNDAQSKFHLFNDSGIATTKGMAIFLTSSGWAAPYANVAGFWNYESGDLIFAAHNAEQLRVSNGKNGFGIAVPLARLHVVDTTTTTNAVREVQRIEARVSTGAVGGANGFGAGLSFAGETATDETQQLMAMFGGQFATATNASFKGRAVIGVYDAAVPAFANYREVFRGESNGSETMIGFHGVPAIARAVLATGVGATVDNVITALQNLGLVKQS